MNKPEKRKRFNLYYIFLEDKENRSLSSIKIGKFGVLFSQISMKHARHVSTTHSNYESPVLMSEKQK